MKKLDVSDPSASALSQRYPHTKEQSGELLRMALSCMGQQPAALNPLTYAVWYEHLGRGNPPLSTEIGRAEAQAAPIDDVAIARLYRRHISPADTDAMERIGLDLQRLMKNLVQSASQTGDRAGKFGAQLDSLTSMLSKPGLEMLASKLGEVMNGTELMSESVRTLQQQVVASNDEVCRLREELDRARAEAFLDPLTGVLNRKGFDRALDELLASQPEASHCLLLFDIDHFKRVNDGHGHVVGDMVIRGVGQILRSTDVGPGSHVARYGGEEFAVLMPRSGLEQSLQAAETIRRQAKAMRVRNRVSGTDVVSITVSGGVALVQPNDDAQSFLARADAALYRSKHAGRDRVSC